MKLYNSLGPNPRLVRMFMMEKGIELPTEEIDIDAGENRGDAYKKLNPSGQVPSLELDDGSILSETIAICEYLDEKYPDPPLIGETPEERAKTRMWQRRCELNITEPLANGYRYGEGLAMFKDRLHVIPQASDDLKAIARENQQWLDGLIAGRDYIAGDKLRLVDLHLYCLLDIAPSVGQPLDESNKNLDAWYRRMGARPSAGQSIHPMARAAGIRM